MLFTYIPQLDTFTPTGKLGVKCIMLSIVPVGNLIFWDSDS